MQSKKMSMVESAASTAVGYTVATAANYFILPLFGYAVSLADASWIGVIFTVISLARGYFVRRLFNWMHMRQLYKLAGLPPEIKMTATELRTRIERGYRG